MSLASRDGSAVVDVLDQGPGVDEDERDRIFNAFFQGRARASGPIKGTGLGLSISREFIHLHNGTIEVVSDDRGAHFRVVLPCERAGEPAPEDAGPVTEGAGEARA